MDPSPLVLCTINLELEGEDFLFDLLFSNGECPLPCLNTWPQTIIIKIGQDTKNIYNIINTLSFMRALEKFSALRNRKKNDLFFFGKYHNLSFILGFSFKTKQNKKKQILQQHKGTAAFTSWSPFGAEQVGKTCA